MRITIFKLLVILPVFLTTWCTPKIFAQQYHTANVGTLVSNTDANALTGYGTYDFQTGNGSGNVNYPPLDNQYGNLINFSSANFGTQFLSKHGANTQLFFRVNYFSGGGYTGWREVALMQSNGDLNIPGNIATNGTTTMLWGAQASQYQSLLFAGWGIAHGGIFWKGADRSFTMSTGDYINGAGTVHNYGDITLNVEGVVKTKEVNVTMTGWPDFVFKPNYRLPTLEQLSDQIRSSGHLPDMPSAKEIENKGLNLGAINKLQQQKIEELILYLIKEDRKIEEQRKQLNEQQAEIEQLKNMVKTLLPEKPEEKNQ